MSSYSGTGKGSNVWVVARTRPTLKFARDLISLESDGKTITTSLPKREGLPPCYLENVQQKWSFKVDKYLHEASQEQVFNECGQSLVAHVLEGFNATFMAYGQTGAGKTHTMSGTSGHFDERGVIPRAVSNLFKEIASKPELHTSVRVSYLEIYNDNVRDLLANLPPNSKEQLISSPGNDYTICEDENGSVYVKGLTIHPAKNEEEALNMLFEGDSNRVISGHSLNLHSSRSHCIFTIYVEARSRTDSRYSLSKFNLVDLAGSERVGKTHAEGSTQVEARYINKSLSFLEQVVLALENSRSFVPYRQCKLTHYLKDSLGGNCCTIVVANIWPEAKHIEETICTLRFANRIMRVNNHPVQNFFQDPQQLIKEQAEEIKMLRMELAMHNTMLGKPSISYEPLSEVEQQELEQQIKLYISGSIPNLEVKSVRQVKEIFQKLKGLVISAERSLTQSTCSFNNIEMHLPTQPSTADTQQSHKRVSIAPKRSKRQTTTSVTLSESEPEALPAQDNRVGETDGVGFAIGKASIDIKSTISPVAAVKKISKPSGSMTSPNKYKGKDEVKVAIDGDGEQSSAMSEEGSQVPPSKEEEFEKFKKGRGKKINAIFLDNKEQYLAKKKQCLELSDLVNELKTDIDKEMKYLNDLKKENEAKRKFPISESGENLMDEEEFQAVRQLNKLKADYRKKYEQFKDEQQYMRVLKQYMDRSRSKLLLEFEEWYKICYVGGEALEEEDSESKRIFTDRERFEKHQSTLLKDDPSTVAFYNAQVRTQQRFQTPSIRSQSRKPGQVMVSVNNRPPGVMTII